MKRIARGEIAVALLGLAIPASMATPVDTRSLPPVHAPTASTSAAKPAGTAFLPGHEMMATRSVLNDLLQIAEILQNEARNLEADAADIWTQWRNVAPPLQTGSTPNEEMWHNDVFAVYSAGRLTNERAHRLLESLRLAESEWWEHWHELDAEASAGRDGVSARPKLEKFKATLAGIAGESNALNSSVRGGQGQYDLIRPRLLEYMTRTNSTRPVFRTAWHWGYVQSGVPRPDMAYDYPSKFSRHYAESLKYLRSNRGPGGKKPRRPGAE